MEASFWPPHWGQGLCIPDLDVDDKTCMAPAENLLHQGKCNALIPEKQIEGLMGEESLDKLIRVAKNKVEGD